MSKETVKATENKDVVVQPAPKLGPAEMSSEQLALELNFQYRQLMNAQANIKLINSVLENRTKQDAEPTG